MKGENMNVSIRKRYYELRDESMKLKNALFDENIDFDTHVKLTKEQDKIYKKYLFYKNFLKASEKRA